MNPHLVNVSSPCNPRRHGCLVHWINLGHWVRYPIQVPDPKQRTEWFSPASIMCDNSIVMRFVWVHCGPAALLPKQPTVVYFHTETCVDNRCDGECLYAPET